MIWQMVNFTKDRHLIAMVRSGDKFIVCKLLQKEFVKIFVGLTDLWFIESNLNNADIPADSRHSGCSTAINEYQEDYDYYKGKVAIRHTLIKPLGKKEITKMTKFERASIFASPDVTDYIIKKHYAKEIKDAKALIKAVK